MLKQSKAGLAQSLVGITTPFPWSWGAQGFFCTIGASLVGLRFYFKHNYTPPTFLGGASPLHLDWGIFYGGIQHSPVNGCSAVSCDFGVITGEDEHTSFYSAILE